MSKPVRIGALASLALLLGAGPALAHEGFRRGHPGRVGSAVVAKRPIHHGPAAPLRALAVKGYRGEGRFVDHTVSFRRGKRGFVKRRGFRRFGRRFGRGFGRRH